MVIVRCHCMGTIHIHVTPILQISKTTAYNHYYTDYQTDKPPFFHLLAPLYPYIIIYVEAGKITQLMIQHYLKSKGKDNGTYIRVAGTSRQAFPEKKKNWKWKEPESHGMSLLVWVILFQRKQQRNFVRISKSFGRKQECQNIL